MIGQVIATQDIVTCNVMDCHTIATFSWVYENESGNVNRVDGDNIIKWLGHGRYYVEVTCGNIKGKFMGEFLSNDGMEYGAPAVQTAIQKQVQIEYKPYFDFDKLPKSEYKNVKQLFKDDKLKELALIHNKYELSNWRSCCDLTPIRENFGWFVKSLKKNVKQKK